MTDLPKQTPDPQMVADVDNSAELLLLRRRGTPAGTSMSRDPGSHHPEPRVSNVLKGPLPLCLLYQWISLTDRLEGFLELVAITFDVEAGRRVMTIHREAQRFDGNQP